MATNKKTDDKSKGKGSASQATGTKGKEGREGQGRSSTEQGQSGGKPGRAPEERGGGKKAPRSS